MTMGDWLVDKGLEQPRPPRSRAAGGGPSATAPSLNALRRRHQAHASAQLGGRADSQHGGRQVHPF